jgi:elongation factor P hydroxylase
LTKAQPKISVFSKKNQLNISVNSANESDSIGIASANILIGLFNQCFQVSYNTCLEGGASEPEYLPANQECGYHRVIFTQDYVSSALHEIAHWCIAGEDRRLLNDYGYWYEPDGRNDEQQAHFESVEIKPQALEWIFSKASGVKFSISADNLDTGCLPSATFSQAIETQAKEFCCRGVNDRAMTWINALSNKFKRSSVLDPDQYCLSDLK